MSFHIQQVVFSPLLAVIALTLILLRGFTQCCLSKAASPESETGGVWKVKG